MKFKWLLLIVLWQIIGAGVLLLVYVPVENFHFFFNSLIRYLSYTNCIVIAGFCFYFLDQKWLIRLIPNRYVRHAISFIMALITLFITTELAIYDGCYICRFIDYAEDQWQVLFLMVKLVVLASVTLAVILYFLHHRITRRLAMNIEENEKLKRLQLESKLSLLQSKINPHFLFNTLNTMLDIVKRDPNEVERIILNLSDIYRKTLMSPDKALIPLKEELELVEKYLAIEQVRMGSRLRYHIDVPEPLGSFQIPPMMIQILVENAVKHGISPVQDGGLITVTAQEARYGVVIEVTDDGVGMDIHSEHTGHGLYNIQQRIKLHYGDRGILSIHTPDAGGTQVRIAVPYENQNGHR